MMRSFLKLTDVKPGFEARNALTAQIPLPSARYRDSQVRVFFQQLIERTRALPGVSAVGATTHLPLSGQDSRIGIGVEGREPNPQEPTRAHWRVVTPDYFRAMGVPLLEGRMPVEQDAAQNAPPVALINRTAADRYWPGQSPVGKRLRIGGTAVWREIIGVTGDINHGGLEKNANPELYLPGFNSSMTIVARVNADPASLAGAFRAQVRELDRELPVTDVRTMEEVVARSVASPRFYTLLFGVFAAVALLLAAAGVYGVMTYSVAQRAHEIGVRMALGAEARDALRLVIGRSIKQALLGVTLGLLASLALTRLMKELLFGVSPYDPLTLAGIASLLTAMALLAAFVPARRATKVDPVVALRNE
jgi:putative ABC transport system permease protein